MSNIKERKPMTLIKIEMPGQTIQTKYGPRKTTQIEIITLDSPFEAVVKSFHDSSRGMVLGGHKRCVPKRYIIDIKELVSSEYGEDYEFWIHSQPKSIQGPLWCIVDERLSKKLKIKGIGHIQEIARNRGIIK